MSKRLFDTEVWKKPWFFDLPDKMKLFWFYILSDCDAAGIWTANVKIAKAYLGDVDLEKVAMTFKDQVSIINGGNYWLIKDYIKFQYGYPIRETSPMFKKLSDLLSQRNLSISTLYDCENNTLSNTLCYTVSDRVYDTLKDKDKDIDKDIQEGGVGETKKEISVEEKAWVKAIQENYPKLFKMKTPMSFENHNKLVEKWGKVAVKLVYERMENWPELVKKRDNAYLTARTFLRQGS